MKNTLIAFILLTVFACTATKELTTVEGAYDSVADIGLFLSTSDKNVENQVIDRLKLHDVDAAQIKQLLRTTFSAPSNNPAGLQSNLKIKIKQKNIHMLSMFRI
jgi:hypothetical protein